MSVYKAATRRLVQAILSHFSFRTDRERRLFIMRAEKLLATVDSLEDDQTFFEHLEFFLASLRNGHTRLHSFPTKIWYRPSGYRVVVSKAIFHLVQNSKRIGVIRTIDGRAPQDILRYHLKRIGGGTIEYRTNQAIKFLLFSHEPNDAEIELTTKKKIRVSRVRSTGTPTSPNVHQRLLQKKYLYLKIPAWDPNVLTADVISALVKKRNEARGVIIDVRGNGGGSTVPAFQVASYFLQNTTSFGEVRIKNRRKTLLVPPHPDATNTPLAVLTDIECLSSNEIFIAGLHDSGRAIVIGETTGGSSGNPTLITIPFRDGSFTVKVATWNYVRPNGKRLEGKGIQPDLVVHANTKKDEALLKAIKYIKKKNS